MWRAAVGKVSFSSPAPVKFSIQSASAKFPYRIRMICGDVEIPMLNLKTIGRLYDDDLIINAGSGPRRMRSWQG
jgi:hypothetical protein